MSEQNEEKVLIPIPQEDKKKKKKMKRKDSDLVSSYEVGQKIIGTITQIQHDSMFITFSSLCYGRCHLTTFNIFQDKDKYSSDFFKYQLKDEIETYIIKKEQIKNKTVFELAYDQQKCELQLNQKSEERYGVITSIDQIKINPLILSINHQEKQKIHFSQLKIQDLQILNNLQNTFQLGQICRWPQDFKPISNETQFKAGDLVFVKVLKINHQMQAALCQVTDKLIGSIDVTQISDEMIQTPLKSLVESQIYQGRILEVKESKAQISLLKEQTNESTYQILMKGSSLQFLSNFQTKIDQGDVKAKLFKYGKESLKQGDIVQGYISSLNDKGCFIKISYNVIVRASINEITDSPLPNLSEIFYKGKAILCRVVAIKKGLIHVSMRKSVVVQGIKLNLSQIRKGKLVMCTVNSFMTKKNKCLIRIDASNFKSKMGFKKLQAVIPSSANSKAPLQQLVQMGQQICCEILKVDKNATPIQIKLKALDLQQVDKNKIVNLTQSKELDLLFDSVMNLSLEQTLEQVQKEKQTEMQQNEEEAKKQEIVENGITFNEHYVSEDSDQENNKQQFSEFIQEADQMDIEKNSKEPSEEKEAQEENQDQESENNEKVEKSKKSKKRKGSKLQSQEVQKEKRIRKKELEKFQNPELLLASDHNNSQVWLQYIAQTFEKYGKEAASDLFQRALNTVDIEAEDQKLNLHIA